MKSEGTFGEILGRATGLVAQPPAPKTPKKKASAPAVTAADLQALKDAIESQQAALAQQQQQLQELRAELRRKDQVVQQAQTTATDAAGKADAAQARATQQQADVTAVQTADTDREGNRA